MSADVNGRVYAKLSDVHPGDTLEIDSGFTCTSAGENLIYIDEIGELYFKCADSSGKHYISGQEDEDGYLIGLYPV